MIIQFYSCREFQNSNQLSGLYLLIEWRIIQFK